MCLYVTVHWSVPNSWRITSVNKKKKVKQKRLELLLNNDIGQENTNQKMASWSAFNSVFFQRNTEPKDSRFLPVIPSPVTDHQTVYTALKNF